MNDDEAAAGDRTYREAVEAKAAELQPLLEGLTVTIKELSAALDRTSNAFANAVQQLIGTIRKAYHEAGSPEGPADDWENVVRWLEGQARVASLDWRVYDDALRQWAVEDTEAMLRGAPRPELPQEPEE